MQETAVFFLIAGEASGDILGARLMRALRQKLNGNVRFAGIGGPQMVAEGLDLLFPHTELMHFGIFEVLRHIPRLLKRINQAADEVIRVRPAALITIDSPDFCFRVAKKVRKSSATFPLIHYVAPTVWAWRPGRAKKIAGFLDHLLAVLPFEPPYFTRVGLGCTFVGHALIESDAGKGSDEMFRAARDIAPETILLTMLPGSRNGEIARLLPVFRDTVKVLRGKYRDLEIVVPVVAHLKDRLAQEIATWGVPFHIVEGEREKYHALAASTAALACSGTVALELALAGLPAIIAYKMHPLTVALFRRFMRVRYANLVNIMHDREVVPEFLQHFCTADAMAAALDRLLGDANARQQQITALAKTAQWLGRGQVMPSQKAAEVVLQEVGKRVVAGGERSSAIHDAIHQSHSLSSQAPPPAARLLTVLQILPALVTGGVERGTVEVAAALVAAGHRALVASAGGPMVREIEAAGGMHITLPLKSKNPFVMWKNIDRLSQVIRQHKVDIVHARSRAPAWSGSFAAKKTGAHFVTTFHNIYGAGFFLKRWYNAVMGKGERVIAISDYVAAAAELIYNVPHHITRVIPRGVDIEKFDRDKVTQDRIDALRRVWNLPIDTPVILMPGRITRWKGQSVLIAALAQLRRRDFVCVIVGGGKDSAYGRELRREIKRHGLQQNCVLVDTCRDMPAAYALAAVVTVPSTRPEGFGRVVIEAQAMAVPVIASNHGGACETVIPGQTGWLTESGNVDALARAIDQVLMLNNEERTKFSIQAVAHISAHFTTRAMTDKTLAVYREVISDNLPASSEP